MDHALMRLHGEPCEIIQAGLPLHGQMATDTRPGRRKHRRRQACGIAGTPYPRGGNTSGGWYWPPWSCACQPAPRLVAPARRLQANLLPQLDTGLSALLAALKARGLLDTTTVFVVGEFGRTPKVNERAGRDHWPRAMTALLAGGGVKVGQVVGASDAKGMGPDGNGFTPDQLAATFYRTLGIDHTKEYHTATGRPVMIVREGSVIRELVG